jgi:hypothetical protein
LVFPTIRFAFDDTTFDETFFSGIIFNGTLAISFARSAAGNGEDQLDLMFELTSASSPAYALSLS